ncbi:MAG: hypothetical protein ACI8PZ_003068 [Myxococcota bacterium]|jgi:hypothetical protein
MTVLFALFLACGSSPDAPTASGGDAIPPEPAAAPAAEATPEPVKNTQLVRGRDGSVVEIEIAPPWGAIRLPMEDGTIKRVSPSLIVVDFGKDHPAPKGRALAWCDAIRASGNTCGESDPGLPEDGYNAPVTINGEGMRLKLLRMMGNWVVMITPPPPPKGALPRSGSTK